MSNALKHEITNNKLRHDIDEFGVAIGALLNCMIEKPPVQENKNNIAGFGKYPTRLRVRRQKRKMSRRPAPAHSLAVERPFYLHIGTIINPERRNPQSRKCDINIAQLKTRSRYYIPVILWADECDFRTCKIVHNL